MQRFITNIKEWLQHHKSTTLPAWLKRHPDIQQWLMESTYQYNPRNIMESVYIVLNGPPKKCKFGNFRKFNTFELGYREGCILGNRCKCIGEIRLRRQQHTVESKYGVSTTGQIPGVLEKRKATMYKKYGVEFAAHSPEIQKKRKEKISTQTLEFKSSIRAKSKKTNLEKYGVEHHMKLNSQKNKVKETNIKKYGVEFPLQNLSIAQQMSDTWKSKSIEQLSNITLKTKNTLTSRYAVDAASRIGMLASTLEILDNENLFKSTITGLTRLEAIQKLDIAEHTLYLYAKKYQAFDLFARPATSKFELAVREYVESLGMNAIYNSRNIISPTELDIFIPEKNTAIECSGLYWHSEHSANRTSVYHKNKHDRCADMGIKLITLFDDEWNNKNNLVKQRLCYILGKSTDKIYARDCKIVEVTSAEVNKFINAHHLQGAIASKINLVLLHNEIVVAAMTIGIPRYNKKYQYEILRFCTNGQVVGAASKLFTYFKRTRLPDSVISYSDNRWGKGEVYTAMGFKKISETVGYFYTDYKSRFNRTQFQKYKLVAAGADPALSEWEIMQSWGYDRIWDCGQSLWIYTSG